MKILILGGCGFVGSNLAVYIKNKYPSYEVISFDNLQRLGSELNIIRLKKEGVVFCHGDIRNIEDLNLINEVEIIIDVSAEASVLSGLSSNPHKLINTNLLGTINCLEFARQQRAQLIFLSSSRVYPIELLNNAKYEENDTHYKWTNNQDISGINSMGVSEDFPLVGYRSFYGATKLASELLINEYVKFYNLEAIINRCGVISGPWQMAKVDQGFVALWLIKHCYGGELTYNGYNGQGKQLRDVLHIDDLCNLIDIQIHNFGIYNRETFNIGGGIENTISLCELTKVCEELSSNSISIQPAKEREADIRIYYTNNEKISSISGWKPVRDVRKTLKDIYSWISKYENTLRNYL